jgi:hypothetical protein
VNDFATLMDHDALLAALGEQAPKSVPVQAYALRLLLSTATASGSPTAISLQRWSMTRYPGPKGAPFG